MGFDCGISGMVLGKFFLVYYSGCNKLRSFDKQSPSNFSRNTLFSILFFHFFSVWFAFQKRQNVSTHEISSIINSQFLSKFLISDDNGEKRNRFKWITHIETCNDWNCSKPKIKGETTKTKCQNPHSQHALLLSFPLGSFETHCLHASKDDVTLFVDFKLEYESAHLICAIYCSLVCFVHPSSLYFVHLTIANSNVLSSVVLTKFCFSQNPC